MRELLISGGPQKLEEEFNKLPEDEKAESFRRMASLLDDLFQRDCLYREQRFGLQKAEPIPLFEFDLLPQDLIEEFPDKEVIELPAPDKKKKKRTKKTFADTSKLEVRIIEKEPEITECPECGSELEIIKYSIDRKVHYRPAQMYVEEIRQPVMGCPKCTDDDGNTLAFEPEPAPALIEKSLVTPELLANIAFMTYMAGVPYYRQEKLLGEKGIGLSRQTMVNWMDAVYDQYLIYIVQLIYDDFARQSYVHLDESSHKIVQNRKDRSNSYELVGRSGRSEPHQMAVFKYSRTRSNETVPAMVGERYEGVMQTDGYQTYHSYLRHVSTAEGIGCWAHVLIKFKEALLADEAFKKIAKLPVEQQAAALREYPKLYPFVVLRNLISYLFELEREAEKLVPDWNAIREYRDKYLRPVMKTIFARAQQMADKTPPKGKKGEALTYVVNQKEYLERVLEDGRYELTNLPAERLVKRFVLWRKNSLFSFSEGGAKRMSAFMTILMSAKLNDLDPERYLAWILNQMITRRLSDEDLRDLLPYSPKIPDELHTKTRTMHTLSEK